MVVVEEAGSEASVWENRGLEEQLAQLLEEEARLGGRLICFPMSGGLFLIFFPYVRHLGQHSSGLRSVEAVKAHIYIAAMISNGRILR